MLEFFESGIPLHSHIHTDGVFLNILEKAGFQALSFLSNFRVWVLRFVIKWTVWFIFKKITHFNEVIDFISNKIKN